MSSCCSRCVELVHGAVKITHTGRQSFQNKTRARYTLCFIHQCRPGAGGMCLWGSSLCRAEYECTYTSSFHGAHSNAPNPLKSGNVLYIFLFSICSLLRTISSSKLSARVTFLSPYKILMYIFMCTLSTHYAPLRP